MASILLSGPAGAGKSKEGKRLLAESQQPTILVEYQEILAALLGISRDSATGRYPERRPQDAYALPLAAAIRRYTIVEAVARDLDVVASNSDGDPERRAGLLRIMGPGASERIIDPGIGVVRERLTFGLDYEPSAQCEKAIQLWYGRINGPASL